MCVCVCVGVQERFFFFCHPQLLVHPHFIYVGAGSKKKQQKNSCCSRLFLSLFEFQRCGSSAPIVCNECRFCHNCFIYSKMKKGAILFETTVIMLFFFSFGVFFFYIKAPTVA